MLLVQHILHIFTPFLWLYLICRYLELSYEWYASAGWKYRWTSVLQVFKYCNTEYSALKTFTRGLHMLHNPKPNFPMVLLGSINNLANGSDKSISINHYFVAVAPRTAFSVNLTRFSLSISNFLQRLSATSCGKVDWRAESCKSHSQYIQLHKL